MKENSKPLTLSLPGFAKATPGPSESHPPAEAESVGGSKGERPRLVHG
jgi:hypothetical protein